MKYNRADRARMRSTIDTTDTSTSTSETGPIFFWRESEQLYGFFCQWYTRRFTDPDRHLTHVFICAEQYMMYRKALVIATSDPAAEPRQQDINSNPTRGATSAARESDNSNRTKAWSGSWAKKQGPRSAISKGNLTAQQLPDAILAEPKAARQKFLARSIPFIEAQRKRWEEIKFDVVCQGSYLKFSQNARLKILLLETGERELVEAAPNDTVWGIGFAAEMAEDMRWCWGSNLLGKALESARARIRAEEGARDSGGMAPAEERITET